MYFALTEKNSTACSCIILIIYERICDGVINRCEQSLRVLYNICIIAIPHSASIMVHSSGIKIEEAVNRCLWAEKTNLTIASTEKSAKDLPEIALHGL